MAMNPKDLLVWIKSLARGQALPLDASEVHESLKAAQDYAGTAIAYGGQTVKVKLDDGKYHEYILQPSGDGYQLEEIRGGGSAGIHVGDESSMPEGTVLHIDPTGEGYEMIELDATLSKAGYAADAKAVGDKLGEVSKTIKTIPKVFDWANAELPFTESEISGTVSGAGFVVNPTNFADGKTYFRYHAGASYGFRWTNPNPQKGSLTITMRGYSQYSSSLSTKIVTVYTDGTDNSLTDMMRLKHGETVTYTTDPDKTVDYIRGNYDFENWVLLDMDVLSIVADYPAPTGTVKDEEAIEMLIETDMLPATTTASGAILTDQNGNVILRY